LGVSVFSSKNSKVDLQFTGSHEGGNFCYNESGRMTALHNSKHGEARRQALETQRSSRGY
jgi:hypothetical protein